MGVSTLVGQADGTTDAAAMYDRSTGWMIGPIFEAPDAAEQVDAFQQWLREGKWYSARESIFDAPQAHLDFRVGFSDGTDPRSWTSQGLEKLVSYWRSIALADDGWLLNPFECACGKGHTHMGESGEVARHGECFDAPACTCTTWTPGNRAAAAAAEGD